MSMHTTNGQHPQAARRLVPERNLPAAVKRLLPSTQLPLEYEEARRAIANCETVERAKKFADQTEALAHFYKLQGATHLFDAAMRLQRYAQIQCGELLNAIPRPRGGKPVSDKNSLRSLAQRTGLSTDAINVYRRAARVPADVRSNRIEESPVPTIKTIAQMAPPGASPGRARTDGFNGAASYMEIFGPNSALSSFLSFTRRYEAADWARKLNAEEAKQARKRLTEIAEWVDRFDQSLPKDTAGTGEMGTAAGASLERAIEPSSHALPSIEEIEAAIDGSRERRAEAPQRFHSRMISVREICDLLSVCSSTIYRAMSLGLWPRPVHIGRAARWPLHEVQRLIQMRVVATNEKEIRTQVTGMMEQRSSPPEATSR